VKSEKYKLAQIRSYFSRFTFHLRSAFPQQALLVRFHIPLSAWLARIRRQFQESLLSDTLRNRIFVNPAEQLIQFCNPLLALCDSFLFINA
jgi:hypothetical protein